MSAFLADDPISVTAQPEQLPRPACSDGGAVREAEHWAGLVKVRSPSAQPLACAAHHQCGAPPAGTGGVR
jgi:hypothetical protein